MKKHDLYDPDYTYKNHHLAQGKSREGYPIIERTNNGLIFPEAPQSDIDTPQLKDDEL